MRGLYAFLCVLDSSSLSGQGFLLHIRDVQGPDQVSEPVSLLKSNTVFKCIQEYDDSSAASSHTVLN